MLGVAALPAVFALNLLCSLVPCEPNFGTPDTTNDKSRGYQSNSVGFYYGKDKDILEPLIYTKSGRVEGYIMTILQGRKIFAFEGIPYAEPPINENRFRNPILKAPWSGVFKAKSPGPICLQFHLLKVARITGVEDCLTLNIYTPKIPQYHNGLQTRPNLPVILWIHGGGGWFGSGSEAGPSYFLQEDVIVVTIQYRLGLLGLFSTGDKESPGNYALMDQNVAIQFVHNNIRNFGGDPSRIVLMGVSSGATFTHLHMMSPLSKHLISGGISLSGTGLNHWAVSSTDKVLRLKARLARRLSCPAESKAFMECIREVQPKLLVQVQRQLFDYIVFPPIIFAPVVDGVFLTDTPENLYARNEVARVPWIGSTTTEEADSVILLYNTTGLANNLLRSFNRVAQDFLDYRYSSPNITATTERLRRFYIRGATPTTTEFSLMASDRFFGNGLHKALRHHCKIAPTYGLRFGFRSEVGYTSALGLDPEEFGVGHSTDTGFYFNSSSFFLPIKVGSPSYEVSRMMINIFANFAYTGKPMIRYKNGRTVDIWKRITSPRDITYLLVDNKNVVQIPEIRSKAQRLWRKLGLSDSLPNPFEWATRMPNPYRNTIL